MMTAGPPAGLEPDAAETILQTFDLQKSYGAIRAVAGISLTIARGELVAVVGPNGAGKTTLLSVIAGEQRASGGRLQLAGADVTKTGASRRAQYGIARTFQVGRAFRSLSVTDNVALARSVRLKRRWRCANNFTGDTASSLDVSGLLDRLNLGSKAATLAGNLSQGDLKRLDLAIALALDPKVLLLDEPTAGVGVDEARSIARLVVEIWQESPGLAIIFISHDMSIVFEIASRIIVMHEGAVIFEGDADQVRSADRVRALYLGESL
ncbi:MAG TPA: ABC transporter ATP-binding protein [Trebonia sp.]|jgi:branched-chain amino acid transport system ATP-binding protein|nr:ABC transporter ATP-binding protein [Trebonia sp.]